MSAQISLELQLGLEDAVVLARALAIATRLRISLALQRDSACTALLEEKRAHVDLGIRVQMVSFVRMEFVQSTNRLLLQRIRLQYLSTFQIRNCERDTRPTVRLLLLC